MDHLREDVLFTLENFDSEVMIETLNFLITNMES